MCVGTANFVRKVWCCYESLGQGEEGEQGEEGVNLDSVAALEIKVKDKLQFGNASKIPLRYSCESNNSDHNLTFTDMGYDQCRRSEGDLLQTAVYFVLRADVPHSGRFAAVP